MRKQFMEVGHKTRLEARQEALRGNVNKAREKAGLCPIEAPKPRDGIELNWIDPPAPNAKKLRMLQAFGGACLDDFAMQPAFGVRRGAQLKPGAPKRIQAVNCYNGPYDHPKLPPTWRDLFKGHEAYKEKLRKRGYDELGEGFYSAVFGKPGSSKVIKVCHRANHDAYPLFAEWAHKNPSPFLPVVHSFKRFETFYVVVLDRLEKTVRETDDDLGYKHATAHFEKYMKGRIPKSPISEAMIGAAFGFFPGLRELLDAMRKEFDGQANFDMHEENWMVSSTGQLVITDPVSHASNYKGSIEKANKVTRIKGTSRRLTA